MRCAHRQVFSTAATRQMPQPSMPSQGHAFQGHCMPSQGHVSARAGRVTWQKRRQPLQPLRRGVAVVQCDTHTTCPALDGQAEATAVLVVGLEHQYATGRIRSNRASATSTPQAQSMARCASTVRSTGAGLLPGRRRTSTTNSAAWMGDSTRFSVTPAHCQDCASAADGHVLVQRRFAWHHAKPPVSLTTSYAQVTSPPLHVPISSAFHTPGCGKSKAGLRTVELHHGLLLAAQVVPDAVQHLVQPYVRARAVHVPCAAVASSATQEQLRQLSWIPLNW